MEFLQSIDLGALLLVGVALVLLCVIGLLLVFGLQFMGGALGSLFSLFGLAGDVVSGGPVSWCGCLVVVFVCGLCAGGALLVANCNANPNAMNFCLLLPR